jgi:chromosome partition protein MukB
MRINNRIQRAVLVNWKGMFFQSFEIDPGMTVLEGANGTGKTTIMIAIYTCLMPDLNFLNFQNVTAAGTRRNEDKGLYGRIGQDEKNRNEPIFSLLDILSPSGARHFIGVQLIKKTYPQIALKHFAISNLPPDIHPESLLLDTNSANNEQALLELDGIASRAKEAGGELVLFRHAKDYFRFLFDNEISPLRLIENEERKKYNQLLHTSLYGGLSRSLQSGLREYLLPENDKLVQGIHEMEQNLKSCRRTRSAIQRYHSVREVINDLYDKGLEMYSAAFYATRLEAQIKLKKLLKLRSERKSVKNQLNHLKEEQTQLVDKLAGDEGKLNKSAEEWDLAKQRLERCRSASQITEEIQSKEEVYKKQKEIETSAKKIYLEQKSKEQSFSEEERKLAGKQMELAKHLSDAGQAWQELSRQVGLYQQADRMLQEARKFLQVDELNRNTIPEFLEQTQSNFTAVRQKHQDTFFKLNDTKLKHDHFIRYHEILEKLNEKPVIYEEAGKTAEILIDEFMDTDRQIREAESMPTRLGSLQEKIQNRLRFVSALKTVDLEQVTSSQGFDESREEILNRLKALKTDREENLTEMEQVNSKLRAIDDRLPGVEKKLSEWERSRQLKSELEDRIAGSINDSIELANVQSDTENRLQQLNLEKYELKAKQKQLQKTFNTLINEKTSQPGLKALADQGYGSLLADRYEDIPQDWSSNLEGRLGPLSNALVVKDIHKSANDLIGSFDRPDDIWLVEETLKEKMPEAIELTDSILVKHGDAWRLSRLPENPILGKESRKSMREKLGGEISEISKQLEKTDLEIKTIYQNQLLANKLSSFGAQIQESSPIEEIKELKSGKKELETRLKDLQSRKNQADRQINLAEEQDGVLRQFFPQKDLLDQSDLQNQFDDLQKNWEELQALDSVFNARFPLIKDLQQGLEVLQNPPQVSLEDLQTEEEKDRQIMENQRSALETLERLHENLHYFDYEDQVVLLEEKKSINSHLEEELAGIEDQLSDLKTKIELAVENTEKTADEFHREETRSITLKGQLEMLTNNLSHTGASGSPEDLNQAQELFARIENDKDQTQAQIDKAREGKYKLDAEIQQLEDNLAKVTNRFQQRSQGFRPDISKWTHFRTLSRNERKYEPLLSFYLENIKGTGKQPEVYWRKVSALRATLFSTLEKAHDGQTVLEAIGEMPDQDAENQDQNQGEVCLVIWQIIQKYLAQVIPVDLQTSDPEKAQEAISQKLEVLEENLLQQEKGLRIHVQSIPSHLNAEIQKQKSRIRKLNEKLKTVRFGFLQTIRIQIETNPKLRQFLDILPQQLDIFTDIEEDNVSIETLMADLYEKEGAGKVRGDLLLDYRHYVRLNIEVKREGNQEFEKVTSSNLSTGESIGVGIAVLIMVLMSWEEQSYLARESEIGTSLRFLLLDESSRLDQKALFTLSEFCESLSLQLLIAAPSVERTLKGTTHHLTRGHFNGREEVIVRGRRITTS